MIATTDIREAVNSATRKQPWQRGGLFSQAPASPMTGAAFHPTASLNDVVEHMRDGDGLFYSGPLVNPISLGNRIYTLSEFSHYGQVAKCNRFSADVIDCCCRQGCQRHSLRAAIRANHGQSWRHGQWFWARVDREAYPHFNGEKAVHAGMAMLGEGYGYWGILLQWETRMPVTRELCYFSGASDWAIFSKHKYCSFGGVLWTAAGGENAVPNRAPQLVSPQDLAQSKLFVNPFIALVP